MWLRQMAQLSTTMSQAQRATAFHCALLITSQSCLKRTRRLTFLTSKRFLSPLSVLAPALATFVLGAGASAMSTSAMVVVDVGVAGRRSSCWGLVAAAGGGACGCGSSDSRHGSSRCYLEAAHCGWTGVCLVVGRALTKEATVGRACGCAVQHGPARTSPPRLEQKTEAQAERQLKPVKGSM